MKFHLWVPDFASPAGGIQTFSLFVLRALRELFPAADISVFAKNDRSFIIDKTGAFDSFVGFGWWAAPLRTSTFALRLFERAVKEKPDLILSTHANFAPLARTLQKLLKIRFLVVGHGIEVWKIPSSSNRAALRAGDALVSVSAYTRDQMASSLGIPAGRIALLPNTVDQNSLRPGLKPRYLLKRYGLRPEQPVILSIARLASAERYKGYDQVLRALLRVKKALPEGRYVIGGRGPDRSRVLALIKELGLEANVILAGYIPDHELNGHYNLCDVFAMPSKGEGFGIVFLEAMACGKPVIAGNKDGSVDAVLNGELGVLVDPDDVSQIAEALIAVLERKRADIRGHGTEGGTRIAKARSQKPEDEGERPSDYCHPTSGFSRTPSGVQIPEIVFHPEELRRRVIEAYGYEKFKQRLREIVEPLLKNGKQKAVS